MARPIDYGERTADGPRSEFCYGAVPCCLPPCPSARSAAGTSGFVRPPITPQLPMRASSRGRLGSLSEQLEAARGEAVVVKLQLERANAIMENSTRYQIPADLSAAIYDIALSEGIDPSLGYQLVKIESQFNRKAKSPMQAFGYTQLQVATAKFYQPGIKEKDLYDRDTNLRLGFRFLNELLARFNYDVHLALLAYNRGPARVDEILAQGGNPANGYSDAVLKGYRPIAAPSRRCASQGS